jgi:hypothetical protein
MPKLKANLSISLRLSLLGNKAERRVYPGKNNTKGKPRTTLITVFVKNDITSTSMIVKMLTIRSARFNFIFIG